MAFSGEKLRQIRQARGLSQRDLPVAHDTVSRIESGRRNPHPSTLRKLAEALGVEVRDFFEEVEAAPKEQPVLPSPEWALVAPDEEFDSWIRTAGATDLHKFWNVAGTYARGIEDAERRAHLLNRVQEAISQFFRLQPIDTENTIDRWPAPPAENEGREAG